MALLHNMLISTFCRFNRGYCKGREGLPECGLDDHQVLWRNPAIPLPTLGQICPCQIARNMCYLLLSLEAGGQCFPNVHIV